MTATTGHCSAVCEDKMSYHRKSFRRKMFRGRKCSDYHKKKSAVQREGFGTQLDNPHERHGQWFWLLDEEYAQGCRRLHTRQRRLNSELLRAIDEEDVQRVASCLEYGASADATCGSLGSTTCHLAAVTGNCDIILLLLKHGASLRVLDSQGRSPLHLAACSGKVACVKLLLDNAMDMLNTRTRCQESKNEVHEEVSDLWKHDHVCTKNELPQFEPGSTPLHVACQRLHLECVEVLITAGADITSRDKDGMTPIEVLGEKLVGGSYLHADTTFSKAYRFLLNAGTELLPLSHGAVRTTPLHTAVALQSLEAISLIARSSLFVFNWDKNGLTPMHLAVFLRLQAPLRILIHSQTARRDENDTMTKDESDLPNLAVIDIKDLNGDTPLHVAVTSEWKEGVCILLEAGADVCQRNSNGATVVHLAAESGNSDILKEILNVHESKTTFCSSDYCDERPLFRAVMSRNLDCVRMLLQAGANWKQTLSDKSTVLHRAAKFNCPAILEEFIRRDQNFKTNMINQTETNGMTPLHVACLAGNKPCVEALLSAGCDIGEKMTFKCHKDSTALHLASSEGHFEVVEALLNHNSEREVIEARDSHGFTPLHLACQYGHRECIQKLLLSGADLSAKTYINKSTAISLLLNKVYQPIAFLEEILDAHIKINDFPLNDPQCVITIDYRLLEPRTKDNKQMKVLDALFDTGTNCNQEALVLHPVVESFLFLKWLSWRLSFYNSFVIYVTFLLCFSALVVSNYYLKDNGYEIPEGMSDDYVRPAVQMTLTLLIFAEIISAYRLPKYYVTDLESWLKWSSYILALSVTTFELNEEWHRFLTTLAILLSWTELMFQVSRNPNWGFHINMFSKVAVNVLKVLLTFIFLIIGFALAFMVQFKSEPPFDSPLEAFMKTVVMMTNEFEYSSLFRENENIALPLFGRILFLLFILMVVIMLMNLLVGLAVSDINSLVTRGKRNRLRKQADFLRVIQPLDFDVWFMPNWVNRRMNALRKVQEPIRIYPGNQQRNEQLSIPKRIVDAIIARAEKQRMTEKIYTMRNLFMKMNELVTSLNKPSPVTDFISGSEDKNLRRRKEQRNLCNELHEISSGSFVARKLDNIEIQLSAIKELIQVLPQEFSIQVK